ncbi:translocation/assembly module TamB domain-containing protein [Lacinutrix salivirga]
MNKDNLNKKTNVKKKKKHRILRIFGKTFLILFVVLFLIVLFIRSPFGQNYIINKATSYISNKTKTKVEIEKLFVTFNGDVQLNGLYLEDKTGDTLVYSKSLEANVPLWKMINGEGIGVESLDWEGLRANIIRKDSINGFNFQFLIDAFATETETVADTTATKPLDIVLGKLNLKDIDIVYNDVVSGIDSRFDVGTLQMEMERVNLEAMDFKASEIELANAKIKFFQSDIPVDTNSEATALPKLSVEKITLKNIVANYKSETDRMAATINIANFYTEIPNANLADNTIEINTLDLKNSVIAIYTETENNAITDKAEDVTNDIKQDVKNFEWPDLRVSIKRINLENDNISYFVGNAKAIKNQFNPNALVFNNLNLKGHSIFLKDKKGRLDLEFLNFKEASGLNLKNLALNFSVSDKALLIDDLKFQLNNNAINGDLQLDYTSLASLIQKPESSKIALNLPDFKVDLNEVLKFQPELKNNEYFKTLSNRPLTGTLNANGYISNINLQNALINWGNTTRISATGNILNATDVDNLQLVIPNYSAETTKSDLLQFVNENDLGVSLPQNIEIAGTINGSLDNIFTNSKITTSQGIASINGNFKNTNTIAFDAKINIEDYKLSQLLQNETIGNLSLTLDASGKGKTINTLDANLNAIISDFGYNNYAIKNLKLNGNIKDGKGNIRSNYKDDNLNLDLNAAVVLDSVAPEAKINLNVIGANLQGLGVMSRDIRAGLNLKGTFKGNAEKYKFDANIEDGVIIYDNKTYLLGNIDATGFVRKDTTSITLNNKLVDLELQSNTDPQRFSTALTKHLYSYFYRDIEVKDTILSPVNLKLKGHIAQSPLLNDVLLVNAKELDTISINVDFKQAERKLLAEITAPHINYSGLELDSLAFKLNANKTDLNFDFGFKAFKAGAIDIQRTQISADQKNNQMLLSITAYNEEEKLINVLSQITGNRERLSFKVLQDNLTFNQEPWTIPNDNEMSIGENRLEFNNFKISNGNQSVELTDDLPNSSKQHVALDFKNFNLNDFLSYFNAEKSLASGIINGDFILEEPFKDTGILADLEIGKFEVLEAPLGKLSIIGRSLDSDSYAFNTSLKGGDIDLDLIGDYIANKTGANLDLNLSINSFKMKALEQFSQGYLKDTDGDFSGQFKVSGTSTNPKYNGQLNFNNAKLNVAMLNAAFLLEDEAISINNEGIQLSNFTIKDKDNNSLVFTGNIGTKSFINPTFDLGIKAKDFQFINATKEDNDVLYGKASFDANGRLTGDLQIPKLSADVNISSSTDITYVMPSATVNVEKRDGVVVFVNRDNPDAILTQTEEKTAKIKGIDIKTLLNISDKATVTVIIDEETGDYFKVSGNGEFTFLMKPNGRMDLVGTYNVDSGVYEMNLYNIVNRKFHLAPGSKVSWSGDPFDAKLDVRAIYDLKASASPLMAPQLSGADPSIKSKFRQVLPFYVYLNIDGELMAPKISFKLDMPEDEQGAIGGQVYGRVQQVNQQDGELNRQVFSLLVLNRFYPEPGSDGSTGGFATVARDNLNDAVSDQLNMFSNKLLGNSGFELDFGLDSYTDYQGNAPQDRTQLNIAAQKRLFNDRLVVRVGSEVDLQGSSSTGEETPLIGNVSLEYLLTKNGRYKLKGFRRNEFENVIDGQTIVSGIGLIFTQEFNQFSELWDAIIKNETDEEKIEREKIEQNQKSKTEEKTDSINEELNKN